MFILQTNFILKKGNQGDVFVKYTEQTVVKRQVRTTDIKRIYERGMKHALRKPTFEQKVYRERYYCIDSVEYLTNTPLGDEYKFTYDFLPKKEELIPPILCKDSITR